MLITSTEEHGRTVRKLDVVVSVRKERRFCVLGDFAPISIWLLLFTSFLNKSCVYEALCALCTLRQTSDRRYVSNVLIGRACCF